ncbi:restriction endonuclease subunit S [Acinetobacter baumannii]|uniref:restriction endonuclease subunit S n=1 Tax=Acinetobacter baumannii TaxID=470 RepID=UPI00112B0E96|nr:restriction endonuclease subunit S [Acinetobacter baumannii]MDC4651562.1 restriction endonuclease subunit S [Acinetobacter baumannii]MDV7412196.1 restriction endonuclease subunit S [Acinetobacter baumannii]TPU09026.1 restriction endonuclease subunit S [Acinetobacter baumannii]
MISNWTTYKIEDIAEKISIGPFGSRMKSNAYVKNGVPVIRGTNLTGGKRFSGDWVFISEDLAEQLENCCVSNGDLVFPHRGAIGEVGLVDDIFPKYIMSSSLMKLRCNPNLADSEFIYYFFKSNQGKHELLKNASQVGTPGIGQPLSSLKSIEITLPSLSQQKKIAKILSNLDKKIHLNNQINQTLESIAQAIFKSWFVEFEPVLAKIAAKQEDKDPELAAMCAISGKSEAELQQMAEEDFAELKAIAVLFPDELVDSELGELPKGWSIGKVDDILNRIRIKKRFKKKDVNEFGRTFVLEQGSNIILGFHNDEGSIPASKEEPAFIFGDHTCVTKLMLSNFDVSENVIAIIGKERNSYWTYYAIKDLQKFQEYRRHWMELVSKQIVIADINLTDYFAKKVKTLHEAIENFVHENLVLINLRDTLLPKLLSGELNVSMLEDIEHGIS